MKADAEADLTIGGPHLAYEAIWAPDRVGLGLGLVDEHKLGNRVVFGRYRVWS